MLNYLIEQSTQTDMTCSMNSIDFHQGYILIENDNDEPYQPDSPQLIVHIKKEEEQEQEEEEEEVNIKFLFLLFVKNKFE